MQPNEPISLTYGQMSDMVNRIEQIPALSGAGAPTTSTPAFHLGQTYIDTTNGDIYYCSDIYAESGGLPEYTWTLVPAEKTGKAYLLTSDDLNWNSTAGSATEPYDSVALWLLDPGMYYTTYAEQIAVLIDSSGDILEPSSQMALLSLPQSGFITGNNISVTVIDGGGYGYFDVYKMTPTTGVLNAKTKIPFGNIPNVVDNLNSISALAALSANQGRALNEKIEGRVITGAGAPTTSTVGTVGMVYEDTTNGKLYICTDATNPYVWTEVGGGGGGSTITELTQADFNWNSQTGDTTPPLNAVALWKLPFGIYCVDNTGKTVVADQIPVYVSAGMSPSDAVGEYSLYIVAPAESVYSSGYKKIYWMGSVGGYSGITGPYVMRVGTVDVNSGYSGGFDSVVTKTYGDAYYAISDIGSVPTTSTFGQRNHLYAYNAGAGNYELWMHFDEYNGDHIWEKLGSGGSSAIQLTATDYNYDSDNDDVNDCVALWLLDYGLYYVDNPDMSDNPVIVKKNVNDNYGYYGYNAFLVTPSAGDSGWTNIYIFGNSNDPVLTWASTYQSSGYMVNSDRNVATSSDVAAGPYYHPVQENYPSSSPDGYAAWEGYYDSNVGEERRFLYFDMPAKIYFNSTDSLSNVTGLLEKSLHNTGLANVPTFRFTDMTNGDIYIGETDYDGTKVFLKKITGTAI